MGFVGLDVPDDLTNLTLGVEAGPHPRTPPRFRTGILALPMITDREHPVGWGVAWPAWTPQTKTFSGSEVVPLLAAAARILNFFMISSGYGSSSCAAAVDKALRNVSSDDS